MESRLRSLRHGADERRSSGQIFRHLDRRFDLHRTTEIGTVDLSSNTRAVAVVADMTGGTLEQFIFDHDGRTLFT